MFRNTIMGLSFFIITSGIGIELEDDTVLIIPKGYAEELLDVVDDKEFVVEEHRGKYITNSKKEAYMSMNVEATAYISYCDTGCTGVTKTGTNVQDSIIHPNGLKIVATDPNIIPLGSILEIDGELYVADDTGGAIKGNRIDILMNVDDPTSANKFGRQDMTVKVFDGDAKEVLESNRNK